MSLIVLAAGRGSRMGGLTEDRPKCLLPLAGRPLLEWQRDAARRCGIDEPRVVCGYKGDAIRETGLACIENQDWERTNMVSTLWCAEAEFGDDLTVAYGDIAYEPRVLRALGESEHSISVVVDTGWLPYWQRRFDDPLEDAESLQVNASGRILSIGQRVESLDKIMAQYIGLMRFRGAGITALRDVYQAGAESAGRGEPPFGLPRSFESLYMTDLLQALIDAGHDVRALSIERGWLELDSESDYEIAKDVAMATPGGLAISS